MLPIDFFMRKADLSAQRTHEPTSSNGLVDESLFEATEKIGSRSAGEMPKPPDAYSGVIDFVGMYPALHLGEISTL
jgi:hypothetical protein